MAYMQRRRLTTEADISGKSTWRYKLPVVGKYSALEIYISAQRANTRTLNTVVYPMETQLDKVELVQGATRPLISLTGQQLDAANYWTLGRPNARRYRQADATGEDLALFLIAGRGLYDREYGYDFSRLGETYIELTHSLTADATDKFDVSTSVISVYGWQWVGPGEPAFKGYFRDRQLAYWTTGAADTIHNVEIPLGNPIRRIGVQACTRAYTLGGTLSELEVVVDDGAYSPVHVKDIMDWTQAEISEYDLSNLIGGIDYAVGTSEMDLPYWWSYVESVLASPYGYAGEINLETHGISIPARVKANTTGNQEFMFVTRGWGFQKCLRIGFDHEYDGADLLPTQGIGSLDLQCTQAVASAEARVFVQDVVSY
jgi:hypothetical protein